MQASLQGAYESQPSVKKQKCAMRPVGELQKDVVAACIQYNERQICKGENTHSIREISYNLGRHTCKPSIGSFGPERDGTQDNVDGKHVEDEERLSSSGDVSNFADGLFVATTEERRVDENGIELGSHMLWPWNKP